MTTPILTHGSSFTVSKANELNITGRVQNDSDGSVSIIGSLGLYELETFLTNDGLLAGHWRGSRRPELSGQVRSASEHGSVRGKGQQGGSKGDQSQGGREWLQPVRLDWKPGCHDCARLLRLGPVNEERHDLVIPSRGCSALDGTTVVASGRSMTLAEKWRQIRSRACATFMGITDIANRLTLLEWSEYRLHSLRTWLCRWTSILDHKGGNEHESQRSMLWDLSSDRYNT